MHPGEDQWTPLLSCSGEEEEEEEGEKEKEKEEKLCPGVEVAPAINPDRKCHDAVEEELLMAC